MFFLQHRFSFGGLYHQNPIFFLFVPCFYIYIYIKMAQKKRFKKGTHLRNAVPGPFPSNQPNQRHAASCLLPQHESLGLGTQMLKERQVRFVVGFPPPCPGIPWLPSNPWKDESNGILDPLHSTWNSHKKIFYFTVIHEKPYICRCMKNVDIYIYIQSSHGCYFLNFLLVFV